MPNRSLRSLLLASSLLSLVSACGGAKAVKVPLLRPAEINLSSYQTLGVTQLNGDRGGEIAALIEEKLIEGNRFQVVDRAHMDQVMNELRLSASDLAQGNNAVKLGALATAGALVSGNVDEKYREYPRSATYKDNKGVERTDHWTEADLNLHFAVKLLDVSTGRILLARTFEAHRHGGGAHAAVAILNALAGGGGGHPPPDRDKMSNEARHQVVGDFVRTIMPRKEMVEVRFATDGALPMLEGGVGWAERGDWTKAMESFNSAIQAAQTDPKISSPTLAKAYLDNGLAHVMSGDYDAGIKLLGKAYDLAPDGYYLDQIDFAKRLQADAHKVTEQTPTQPTN